ncbi:DUF4231 domain-containing protein [Streptomyces sp. NBC_01205]|uniref:DUF4231 domain-containing protein n=1 Tax=Streptomyces sp. NBC_01205 TaxID=2903771 RepID=UPI002E116506|nr:DUF4231 domain-containing protein [Streptomyces sp. NBC_01205]
MAAIAQYSASSDERVEELQVSIREDERDLAWKKRRTRRFRVAVVLVVLCAAGLVAWSGWASGRHTLLVTGNIVLGTVLGVSALTVLATIADHLFEHGWFTSETNITVPDRYALSTAEVQERLDTSKAALRRATAVAVVPLRERRGMYREELTEVIENYQAESRKYRRVHNGLQSLIMIGSTTITTVAALDAKEWNWQTITVIALGFCVTLASTFTGYFKYRERSYFLQQTADAIEEEANAVALGVGEYGGFGEEEQDQALAKFTQRVESLRNEQRRRQQQLDQPTEHAPVQGASGV